MVRRILMLIACLNKYKLYFLSRILYYIYRIIYSCDIHYRTQIGHNLKLPHNGLGVVINPNSIIGDNCIIMQNVTIGGKNGEKPPVILNNVLIGAGACVLGNIVIGNNVKIGANAVVLQSIPDNCIAVGVPAQIKKNRSLDI